MQHCFCNLGTENIFKGVVFQLKKPLGLWMVRTAVWKMSHIIKVNLVEKSLCRCVLFFSFFMCTCIRGKTPLARIGCNGGVGFAG